MAINISIHATKGVLRKPGQISAELKHWPVGEGMQAYVSLEIRCSTRDGADLVTIYADSAEQLKEIAAAIMAGIEAETAEVPA